jgi:hypothetical protein
MSAGAKPYCPECGKAATGNFCQHCGAKLGGRFCNQCGSKVAPAAAFCNQCGTKVEGGSVGHRAAAVSVVSGQNLPWWIAGAAMFVLIVVVGVNMVQPGGPSAPAANPAAPFAGGAGTGTPPDLSSMTPREAADRLFNRVMTLVEQGDSAGAQAFLPMAIAAYDRAQPLDNDGLVHQAMLNRTAMNFDAALGNAEQILASEPNHILALSEAAQTTIELGRLDDAAEYYRRLVQSYAQEASRPLPEYQGHANLMESARSAAEAFLAAR